MRGCRAAARAAAPTPTALPPPPPPPQAVAPADVKVTVAAAPAPVKKAAPKKVRKETGRPRGRFPSARPTPPARAPRLDPSTV